MRVKLSNVSGCWQTGQRSPGFADRTKTGAVQSSRSRSGSNFDGSTARRLGRSLTLPIRHLCAFASSRETQIGIAVPPIMILSVRGAARRSWTPLSNM